jgi:hypothetical protein
MTRIAAVLGLYLSVQFDIGVWAARRRKSEDDYLSGTFAGWKVPFPHVARRGARDLRRGGMVGEA